MRIFIFTGLTNLSLLGNYVLHLQPGKSSGRSASRLRREGRIGQVTELAEMR